MDTTAAPLTEEQLRTLPLPALAVAAAAGRVSQVAIEDELERRERELDRLALPPAPAGLDVSQRRSGEREDDR